MDDKTERNDYCPECNSVTFQTTCQLDPDCETGGYWAWVCTVCYEDVEILTSSLKD